jgi:hypothetical protein
MADGGITGTVDVVRALAKLKNAEKQGRFALARALTLTAKDAAKDVTDALPQIFDKPTPFTKRSIAITPATAATLQSVVFVKDIQAGYLALEETGGTRGPKPGAPVTLPVNIRTNVYGNIARGRIAKEVAKPDVFVAAGKGLTRHLPPGIYQRRKATRRAGARAPKLLVALEPKATYRPRFGMKKRVRATVLRVFDSRFTESARKALETAR